MGVGNGTYDFIPPEINDWIWGDTIYTWSVNVTDGTLWTNETYTYTTGGSRYDISNNDLVNFQDAGLVWVHRTSEESYDGLYDVNSDGKEFEKFVEITKQYCLSENNVNCKIYIMKKSGETVPIDLHPGGGWL